jgi:hypothetical protein
MGGHAKKEEAVSLEEAAEAFILLHDSGNYNGRRYDRVLGMLRDAVKSKGNANMGPIVPAPEDTRPELDEEQEAAADELIFRGARVEDMIHPGGRLQKGREALDTILKKAEEGTLANDGGRELARLAKEKAAEKVESDAEIQRVAIVPEPRKVVSSGPADEEADASSKKSKDKK